MKMGRGLPAGNLTCAGRKSWPCVRSAQTHCRPARIGGNPSRLLIGVTGFYIEIRRDGQTAFTGETSASQIKRDFGQLAEFLFRSQHFPHGAILLTGTGIVPPDNFTLREQDAIGIKISGIGLLQNHVLLV